MAPPPPSSVDVPTAWSQPASPTGVGTSLARWWQRFDDPTLSMLVGRALEANTSVRSAQAALRQAQALHDVAAAALLPTLDASLSAQRTTGNNATANRLETGVQASWVPDAFGGLRSALAARDATALSSAATLGDTQVQIAAEVALDYVTLRTAQARLVIARDNLASQSETLQITQWREQAGLGTALETEQARASAEQTRALVPALEKTIAQTRHAIAVLTGAAPLAAVGDAPTALDAPTSAIDAAAAAKAVPQPSASLALSIPAETLRQRADVRAAEYQVSAARANVAQAQAQRWPSFSLGGSVGLSALRLSDLTNTASLVSSLLASISVPLFDGGAVRAQVRAQDAALDQANERYRAAVLGALRDVEDALVALRSDQQRVQSLGAAADAAAAAAQLARQRYSGGLVDFQVVLETQRTQLSAQDTLSGARADVSADHVRLFKALGGGWSDAPTAGTTTP